MTKNIEPIYIDRKARGNQLTAEEFNKIPEKVNELIDAHNTEEERVKKVVSKNRPSLGQLSIRSRLKPAYSCGMVISGFR